MKVLVSASAHHLLTPDGTLWTANASLQYRFWTRYLDVFDEVRLLVRAKPVKEVPTGWNKVSGSGIVPVPLPHFIGPLQFLSQLKELRRIIRTELTTPEHAVMLRLPCNIGTEVWQLLETSRPYGVEVVGDPKDTFAPGAIQHPLRPFFRWWLSRQLGQQCRQAIAAAYVTEQVLQQRYPTRTGTVTNHYSSIDLPNEAIVSEPRTSFPKTGTITLITVGTLQQLYKAPDILIRAVNQCIKGGLDLRLVFIGEGQYRVHLETVVATLGLKKRVIFLGQLSQGQAINAELDKADLFILPSRQEGLPRAMIEAMARALPCIGSTVGGIPELLPPEDVVPPNEVDNLASKIHEVINDTERMIRMSKRNLEKAKEYSENILRSRRNTFYQHVQEKTQEWFKSKFHST